MSGHVTALVCKLPLTVTNHLVVLCDSNIILSLHCTFHIKDKLISFLLMRKFFVFIYTFMLFYLISGLVYSYSPPEIRSHISLDSITSRLLQLVKDSEKDVRSKALHALSILFVP